MKKLLKNKLYMSTLSADMLSNFGDVMFYLALMNYVLLLPDAKLAISIITISETLPLFTEIVVGVLADKTKKKIDMIIGTLLFRTVSYVIVGLLLGFTPALWIVGVIACINVLCDVSGKYESGLFIPVSMKIVSDEDRELSMGFRQSVSMTLNIIFQALSAVLVGILSYQVIAVVNAGTFFISAAVMLVLYTRLKRLVLEETSATQETKDDTKESVTQSFMTQIKTVFSELKKYPELQRVIYVLPFLNALFSILFPLIMMMMAEDKSFVIVNQEMTLAMIPMLLAISGIVGSILGSTVFKNTKMMTLLKSAFVMAIGMFVSFVNHFIIGVVICVSGAILLSSALSPKFSSKILNTLPNDTLATVVGVLNTFLQSGIIATQLVLSMMIPVLDASSIVTLFLVLSIVITVYIFSVNRKSE